MATLICILTAYLACGLFYQAKAKRSTLTSLVSEEVINSSLFSWGLRSLGILLLLASIFLATQPQGFERGVTIWLGIVSACGFLGLFIAAWNRTWHLPSMLICLATLLAVSGFI